MLKQKEKFILKAERRYFHLDPECIENVKKTRLGNYSYNVHIIYTPPECNQLQPFTK